MWDADKTIPSKTRSRSCFGVADARLDKTSPSADAFTGFLPKYLICVP